MLSRENPDMLLLRPIMVRRSVNLMTVLSLGLNLAALVYLCASFRDISMFSHYFERMLRIEKRLHPNVDVGGHDQQQHHHIMVRYTATERVQRFNETTPMSDTELRIGRLLDCHRRSPDFRAETLQRGNYWLLKNFVRAQHGLLRCFQTVTYTAHADYTFLDNLQPLLQRWQAPISIALYAPGNDLEPTLESIRYVRDCGPHRDLVRQFATFHLYFPSGHLPYSLPTGPEIARVFRNCSVTPPYKNDQKLYRTSQKLLYPINVGRNIARDAAMTHFVLASDIELYPSPGLAQQFLTMIANNEAPALRGTLPRVWPLAVFEVHARAPVPTNKTGLQRMLHDGTAISFHSRVCVYCHRVPNAKTWIKANQTEKLGIIHVAKRIGKHSYWEPFYIGTHAEPHYDERLSWEGQKNKMTQAYAMCALDYEFQILDNAFLVHRPGIKVFKKDMKRLAFVYKTNRLIRRVIKKELILMYGWRGGCVL